MAEQLTASRAADARVAVAMGWTNIQHWKQNNVVRGIEPGKPSVEPFLIVPRYTTDPALVVPMMERLRELTGRMVHLVTGGPHGDAWMVMAIIPEPRTDIRYEFASTANLAVASALLAVAEAVKGKSDG